MTFNSTINSFPEQVISDFTAQIGEIEAKEKDLQRRKSLSIKACFHALDSLKNWFLYNCSPLNILERQQFDAYKEKLFSQVSFINEFYSLSIWKDHNLENSNQYTFDVDPAINKLNMLTQRQREIVHLLINGYSYKKIGDHLYISTGTVRKHVENIYGRLNISTKGELFNLIVNTNTTN